jgi:hypothetical protein
MLNTVGVATSRCKPVSICSPIDGRRKNGKVSSNHSGDSAYSRALSTEMHDRNYHALFRFLPAITEPLLANGANASVESRAQLMKVSKNNKNSVTADCISDNVATLLLDGLSLIYRTVNKDLEALYNHVLNY